MEESRKPLHDLESLGIPRPYAATTLSTALRTELHIFSDASVKAIAAVAYLHLTDIEGICHVGFVLGKAELVPQIPHTLPRLELGTAILAAEIAEIVSSEFDFIPDCHHLLYSELLSWIPTLSVFFFMGILCQSHSFSHTHCPVL